MESFPWGYTWGGGEIWSNQLFYHGSIETQSHHRLAIFLELGLVISLPAVRKGEIILHNCLACHRTSKKKSALQLAEVRQFAPPHFSRVPVKVNSNHHFVNCLAFFLHACPLDLNLPGHKSIIIINDSFQRIMLNVVNTHMA